MSLTTTLEIPHSHWALMMVTLLVKGPRYLPMGESVGERVKTIEMRGFERERERGLEFCMLCAESL